MRQGMTKYIKPQGMPEFADKMIYPAVQRTLENVWQGKSTPIERACNQVHREYLQEVDAFWVKAALAEFVNLIVRKIFFDDEDEPESIKVLKEMHDWIKEELYKGIIEEYPQRLEYLRKRAKELDAILDPLREEVYEKDHYVNKFRKRKSEHDSRFANYQRRMNELKEAEKQLQAELTKIMGVSPIELEKLITTTQAIAQEARKETTTQ